MQIIYLGGGCFWCIEAVFNRLKGVKSVEPGYMGGDIKNPCYREVCTGITGHAEVIKIEFDPKVISLESILNVFWTSHDPTTLNRQGADVGTQYRSAIYYSQPEQLDKINISIGVANRDFWNNGIVTEVKEAPVFYAAEKYHHNYFDSNPQQPYCQFVINPKIQKLKSNFANLLKS